jgi:hypothetical protein
MADGAVPDAVIQGGVAPDVDQVLQVPPPPPPDDGVMVHGALLPPVMVDSAVPENGNVSVRLQNVFTSHHIGSVYNDLFLYYACHLPFHLHALPQPRHADSHDVVMADGAVPDNGVQGGGAHVDQVLQVPPPPQPPPPPPDDVVMVYGAGRGWWWWGEPLNTWWWW